jgi:ring-1,2-phenylacetyl-CoA epoxidase subunit PaaD
VQSVILNPKSEIIRKLLAEIPDPEIPVITISDLGILRDVTMENEKVVVTITPTYSGCPAMKAIENDIADVLRKNSIENFEIKYTFSPVWTTDWMSEEAKEKLRAYGITPPGKASLDKNVFSLVPKAISCPRCNSKNTELLSQFGSTACKALYRCVDCREPFDYFKCH